MARPGRYPLDRNGIMVRRHPQWEFCNTLPHIADVIAERICVADRKAADFRNWDEADVTDGAARSDDHACKCIEAAL